MSELPATWQEVEIIEILAPNDNGKPFQQGWSPQCERFPAPEAAWGVLRTTAIQHGEFWPHENKALPNHLEPRPQLEVKIGDVVMTCAGPRNRCGVACLVERTRPRLMLSGKMYRFRANPDALVPKYLAYFLRRHETQLEIDRMKTGINDSGLNLTHDRFAALRVPLAPLKEQHRIVAKIEELFSELGKVVESLTLARAQLKVYRQALLKGAFEGRLTVNWRTANPNCSPPKKLPTVDAAGEDELFEVPEEWRHVPLSALTDPDRPITYGVIKLGPEVPGGVPTLRSSDVRPLRLDLSGVKRIAPEIAREFGRTFLKGGEVLITVRGTLGGVAVVPPELSGWNISREVAMIAPTADVTAEYLQYALASPQLAAWFNKRLRGVAYTGINIGTLKDTPIYLCSSEEQHQVVQEIEAKLSCVDAAEREIDRAILRVSTLSQSILKQAFSGQLVSRDLTDEPAAVLLERLRKQALNVRPQRRKTA